MLIAQLMERMTAFSEANVHGMDGADDQIQIEADYIANACENGYDADNVRNFLEKIARTTAGKKLIRCVFCL